MSYIGRGVDAISNVEKLDNITFNGGTTYALTKSSAAFTPVGANNILLSMADDNTDYQIVLEWVAEGNVIEEAD